MTTKPKINANALRANMIAKAPIPPVFTSTFQERAYLKYRLAQALRIFGNRGYDEGIAGHITVRDPIKKDSFWINPFGLHFKQIQPDDLLLVNTVGELQPETVIERAMNVPAFMIHAAVHAARPDVICAAHSHSKYAKAMSALGRQLDMISEDVCAFYNDVGVYEDHHGIAFQVSEGELIANALGSKKAAILKNHGALVVSESIEATVHFYIQLEAACEVQLMADIAAAVRGETTVKVSDAHAQMTGRTLGDTKRLGWIAGMVEFGLLEFLEGEKFDFEQEYAESLEY